MNDLLLILKSLLIPHELNRHKVIQITFEVVVPDWGAHCYLDSKATSVSFLAHSACIDASSTYELFRQPSGDEGYFENKLPSSSGAIILIYTSNCS